MTKKEKENRLLKLVLFDLTFPLEKSSDGTGNLT